MEGIFPVALTEGLQNGLQNGLSVAAVFDAAVWSAQVVRWLATFGMGVLGVGLVLCLLRIVRGPTLADRAVATDALGVQLIGVVVLLVLRTGSLLYVDGMLVLSLLSFAGTVAVAQFIARPHMPEEPEREEPEKEVPHAG